MKKINQIIVNLLVLFLALVLLGIKGGLVLAQTSSVPFLLNYQGKVAKTDGTPLEGPQSMTFFLYDAPQGGNQLWTETQPVMVTKGVFHVLLGQTKSMVGLPWDKTCYLELLVSGVAQFTTRTPIVSVPFAIQAQDSHMVGGKKADGTANNLPVLDGQGKLAGSVISPGTVTSDQLAPKAVKSANLDDKAVTAGKIDTNAVGELQIAAGAIKAGHIGEQMVQTNHIVDGAVTFLKLAHYNKDLPPGSAAVQTGNIEKDAVTDDKISSMSLTKLVCGIGSETRDTKVDRAIDSLIELDGMNVTVTISAGSSLLYWFSANCSNPSGAWTEYEVIVSGPAFPGEKRDNYQRIIEYGGRTGVEGTDYPVSMVGRIKNLIAGTYTIKIRWASQTATSYTRYRSLLVMEFK